MNRPSLNLKNLSANFLKKGTYNNNYDPCEEKWNNGVGYARDSFDKEFISVRNEHQCTVKFGEKVLFVNLKDLRRDDFLKDIPLIEDIPTENGYYTWLIYTRDGEKHFVASKALSILEIGTIHMDIAQRVNASIIHAAGELRVNNGSIAFNLQSGTYMKPAMMSKRGRCGPVDYEELVISKVKDYLGEDAVDTEELLITQNNLPVSLDELNLYEKHGALITVYDSQEACKAANIRKNGGTKKRRTKRKTKRIRR